MASSQSKVSQSNSRNNGNSTTALAPVTNDAERILGELIPYGIEAKIEGVVPFLFHRWSVEAVAVQSKAPKGSKLKKQDDLESYVYRDHEGFLAIPTEYFRMAIIKAAKFRVDPRSSRKSAEDLFKAGISGLEELCSIGVKNWDYVDQRRAVIHRDGITRCRPAMAAGWKVTVYLQVLLPEYISFTVANEVFQMAGRLIGVGDFRPTYGRFQIVGFSVL